MRAISTDDMKRVIAMRMAASINNPDTTDQYASAVEQYAAFTGGKVTSVQERDAVVRIAMTEYSEFFEDLV